MDKYIICILFCFSPVFQIHAGVVVSCKYPSYGEVGNRTFSLPPGSLTISGAIPDYTVLYSFDQIMVGISQGTCTYNRVSIGLNIINIPQSVEGAVNYSGYQIFPTSISGLGLSIKNADMDNKNINVPVFPTVMVKSPNGAMAGIGGWVNIKLWKIPGNIGSGNKGILDFTGPTFQQVYFLESSGDTFVGGSDMTYTPPGSIRSWTVSSRTIKGSLAITNGTCNLSTGDKTVQMGIYDEGRTGPTASWVDASFTLKCPEAGGYGGSYESSSSLANQYSLRGGYTTANTIKNANLTLTVIPLTPIVTRNNYGESIRGTIALDGTGAKGYGIQLAWGENGAQGKGQPLKPVEFNIPVLVSELNSAFKSGPYNIGQAMPTSAIKMAARFIRIDTDTMPGDAKASIEIIANYN